MGGSLSSYLFRVRAKLIIVNSMAPKAPSPPPPWRGSFWGPPRWALILWEAGGPISGNFFSGTSFTVPNIFRKKISEKKISDPNPPFYPKLMAKNLPSVDPFLWKITKMAISRARCGFFWKFFYQSHFLIISHAFITIFFSKTECFWQKNKIWKNLRLDPPIMSPVGLEPAPISWKHQNGHISG